MAAMNSLISKLEKAAQIAAFFVLSTAIGFLVAYSIFGDLWTPR